MARPAIILLLSFCFLLLSGSSYLHVPIRLDDTIVSAYLNKFEKDKQPLMYSKNAAFHRTDPDGFKNDSFNATAPEDDDDPEHSRKHAEIGNDLFPFLGVQQYADVHLHQKNTLPCCAHLALLASDKCILHQVIRI